MKPGFEDLKNNVINRGLCCACGTCIGVCPTGVISVDYDADFGDPSPVLTGECTNCGICLQICPGADLPIPDLEKMVFGRERDETPEDMGIYSSCLWGYAVDDKVRAAGADGGGVSAVLSHALDIGLIDCAIVTGFNEEKPWRAEGKIAVTKEEIVACAQSKSMMVANNAVLSEAVKRGYKKIGIVGCPCHVWGARMIDYHRLPKTLVNKIKLTIALICGGNVGFEATRHILYELCGIENIEDVTKIQYRAGEWPKHLIVNTKDGKERSIDRHLYAYHIQGICYHRDRCKMCLDWAGELADIAFGSYWIEQEPGKEKGYNTVVVRTPVGERLIESARKSGVYHSEPLSLDKVVASYGHEIKKHGMGLILAQRQNFGWPTPNYHRRFSFEPHRKDLWICPQHPQDKASNLLSNR